MHVFELIEKECSRLLAVQKWPYGKTQEENSKNAKGCKGFVKHAVWN